MCINIYKSISFILIFSICFHRTKGPRSPTYNYYLKKNSFLSYFLLSLTPCNHQGKTQLLIGQGRDVCSLPFFISLNLPSYINVRYFQFLLSMSQHMEHTNLIASVSAYWPWYIPINLNFSEGGISDFPFSAL